MGGGGAAPSAPPLNPPMQTMLTQSFVLGSNLLWVSVLSSLYYYFHHLTVQNPFLLQTDHHLQITHLNR